MEKVLHTSSYSYDEIDAIAQYLLQHTKHRPQLGIILGTGCGGLVNTVDDQEIFNYEDIPNFPVSTVPGHAGRLVFGKLSGRDVVMMQGRFHTYEGYPISTCAMPVRVFKLMGAKAMIVTNASGGLNPAFNVGDLMIIKDQLYFPGFAGDNPLRGINDDRFGPRFVAMSNAYDVKLRKLSHKIGKELGFEEFMREGVYTMLGGPSFETIAEGRMLRLLGGDCVGMSTCHEVIVARHCGMDVLGISMITNMIVMDYEDQRLANHEEVLETGRKRSEDIQKLVRHIVSRMEIPAE